MKNIKPQIKSKTRVKSMFDFMKEDDSQRDLPQNSSVSTSNTLNDANVADSANGGYTGTKEVIFVNVSEPTEQDNASPSLNDASDSVDEMSGTNARSVRQPSEKNGVVVLKRTRGDIVVDSQNTDDDEEVEQEQPVRAKKSNIVEIKSQTYNGQGGQAFQKKSFKQYMQGVGVKIAQGWDSFIHKKGAVRFLAIGTMFIVLAVVLMFYASANRTDIKDLVNSTCRAFIYQTGEINGAGSYKTIKVSELAKNSPSEKLSRNYSFIDFTGKDKKKAISINSLDMAIYTATADVTVVVNLTIYYGEEEYLSLDAVIKPKQRVGVAVKFDLSGQSIDFKGQTSIRVTFDCYDSTNYSNFGENAERINPQFVVYNLSYR